MTINQALLVQIRDTAQLLSNLLADLQTDISVPDVPLPVAPRLVFSFPVGDYPHLQLAPWWDATGYNKAYSGGIHTGKDLNLSGYGDSGKPVYCVADGEIVFAGEVKGWQGQVVVVKHTLEDGRLMWSRYAHIRDVTPVGMVRRGDLLGHIADYGNDGPKKDHLHFDLSYTDLGAHPGDWPNNHEVIGRQYVDGVKFIAGRLP